MLMEIKDFQRQKIYIFYRLRTYEWIESETTNGITSPRSMYSNQGLGSRFKSNLLGEELWCASVVQVNIFVEMYTV